jgi:hypothetical protein
MPQNCLQQYSLYKKLHDLPDDSLLHPFEEFLSHSASYDAIEFSQKFAKDGGQFTVNPERYTLWKYRFDSKNDAPFLQHGFHCFEEMARGTAAAGVVARFAGIPLQIAGAEIRYVCMGMEMHKPHDTSRMKLYAGYRSNTPPNLPFICRAELDLTGRWKMDSYQGVPLSNSRIRVLTRGWPSGILSKDVLFFAYAQAGRIHFKIGAKGTEPIMALLRMLTDDEALVVNASRSMIEHNFRFWVLTVREAEMAAKRIENFTVYYRYASAAETSEQ